MKKFFIFIILSVFLGGIAYLIVLIFKQSTETVVNDSASQMSKLEQSLTGINNTDLPLKINGAFEISVFAEKLQRPRVIVFDPVGNLVVSEMGAGRVTMLPDVNSDFRADQGKVIVGNLDRPHGLAFDKNGRLYIAESGGVSRYEYETSTSRAGRRQPLIDLPSGGNHFTRSIAIGPDERLYISTGSTCNVCVEKDGRRAAIWVSELDGSRFGSFATGLRNSVFFVWHPFSLAMWATDNGRDHLGDDLPPDEINIIEEGKFYGWPYCYGKKIQDTSFDRSDTAKAKCNASIASYLDLQAHTAPMGLVFVPGNSSWPKKYWHNLIVALRGSWNRSAAVGYKLIRIQLDEKGVYLGQEDFVSGWLPADARGGEMAGRDAYGRPVGLVFDDAGNLFVSDDTGGRVYVIRPIKE